MVKWNAHGWVLSIPIGVDHNHAHFILIDFYKTIFLFYLRPLPLLLDEPPELPEDLTGDELLLPTEERLGV